MEMEGKVDMDRVMFGLPHSSSTTNSRQCSRAMGHWTRTILEFIGCDQVIPIVEQRLQSLAYDEDDVELQVLLARDLSVELSHLIVKFLKLDAFLKGLGQAG